MYKIVLIDDDAETLKTIAAYYDWNKIGMELAKTADNGTDGLDAILEIKPDIVLIDIKMPGMDGLEVIEESQRRGVFPYFIVMSAYADFEYAQAALRLSVSEYLLKPYSPEELENVFEKAIAELERRIPNLIMPNYGMPRSDSEGLWYPVNREKAIMEIVFTGKKESLAPALESFVDEIFSKNDKQNAFACVSMLYSAIIRPLIERRKSLSIDPTQGIRWVDSDLAKSLHQFLLTILYETYSIIHSVTATNPAVVSAEIFIRTHYKEKLTLEAVSHAVHITPTYLSSLFPKTLGTSFVSYVNHVRIEKAQELLQKTGDDLNTIAEQTGFSDARYFSQVFKRCTGTTPQKYRSGYTKNFLT